MIRWLNENSKKFLEKDYLLPNQTVEERIKIIGDAAEKILGVAGYSEKLQDYIARGWISMSTPVWTNFGTDRGLPISCVSKDTWINTINGGKQAKDIEIGDLVLTHKNRFKQVTDVIPTKNKSDIWKLKVGTRLTDLYITGNHPVLTNLGWVRVDELNLNKHLIAVNGNLEYDEKNHTIDLKEFTDYEYVINDNKICKTVESTNKKVLKKNLKTTHVTTYSTPNEFIEITTNLAWALGVWFAEGSLSTSNKKEPNGIRITVNDKDELWVAEKWLTIMKNSFGVNGGSYTSTVKRNGKNNSWINVNINSKIIGNYFKSFGVGAKDKTLPDYILNLPKEKLQSFLNGLLIGDGSIKNDGSNNLTLSNPKLLLAIYNIGLKLNLDMSLQMQTKAGKLSTTKYVYTISFRGYENSISKNQSTSGIKFNDGLVYCPIRNLEKTDIIDDVYDFTVEDDHSFSCAGVIVHNCFGSVVGDSVESILYTAAEIGTMSKFGGGTSAYMGKVRGRGSEIKSNGKSNGSKSFLELYQTTANVVNQGSVRRGYFAAYQDIFHPDIEEWLNIRAEGDAIQHITWGVCVPTWWINDLKNGDKDKRKIWAKIIQKRFETGLPYIFFNDNANNSSSTPEVYRGKDLIKASQMCVTGDQCVVTDKGIYTVKELYDLGNDLTLFDGEKPVSASPMKLIEKDAKVYKVTLENGMTHTITDYHKVKVYHHYNKSEMVECKNLKIGDKIFVQTKRGLFGNLDMEKEAYLLGLYQSDGTQYKDIIMLDIWENDFDLIDNIQNIFNEIHYKYSANTYTIKNQYNCSSEREIPPSKFIDCNTGDSLVKKKRLSSKTLKKSLNFEKGYVPNWIWKSNEKTQWAYVKGLLQADGSASLDSSNGIQISYTDINKDFLKELQLLFNNLGLNTKIKLLHKEGKTLLPNGLGGYKFYNTKDCWRLYLSNKPDAVEIEKNTGFLTRKGIKLEDRIYKDNTKKAYKIVSIEYVGKEDVYCTTVDSEEHVWVCNGFITSNCTEIFLPSDEENTFVCDLGSMVDLYYDEWKDTDAVEVLTYLLDAAMTEFIEKAKQIKFLERAVKFSEEHRALGIGRLGYHSLLQSKMIPFESLEARILNINIQKTIQEKSLKASKELAILHGECLFTKGLGRRNTTTQAIAPTTSSAFIMQQSQSIEANMANVIIKDLAKGKFVMKNKYLEELLEIKGKNDTSVWDSIIKNHGSVLHLDFLTNDEKIVFKTAREISQEEVIIQAANRQKYIDQGQSLNMFVTAGTTAKEVNRLILLAHDMGVKSLYYQHNVSAASEFSKNFTHCVSCE